MPAPDCCQGPATLQVLVIPGNPGVAGYYIPFLRYLKRSLLPQRADVFACSYIGHTRHSTPRGASKVILETCSAEASVLQKTHRFAAKLSRFTCRNIGTLAMAPHFSDR